MKKLLSGLIIIDGKENNELAFNESLNFITMER